MWKRIMVIAAVLALWMAAPAPPAQLGALKFFLGRWKCEGHVPASPMGPGHKTRSTMTIKLDKISGYYLWTHAEDKMVRDGKPFGNVAMPTTFPAAS